MSTQPDKPRLIVRGQFAFIVWVSALLITPSALGQAPGKDETKPGTQIPHKLHGTLEVGNRVVDTSGTHTAKFQEVREVSEGVLIDNLRLDYDSVDSPYFVTARGTELRERDQRFTIEAGRFGKYRAEFVWDQIPHFFGSGESLFQVAGPGRYTVRPDLRASLQAVTPLDAPNCTPRPDCQRIPVNAALPTLVRQALVFAPVTLVRLGRDQALFRQSYQPTENIELYFQFSWIRNRGTRPMSAGTFVRLPVQSPAGTVPALTDIGGFWSGIGQEFLEPIDQRTTDLKVGAQFRGKRWNAGAEYELSLFRNRVESVIFENPFRVTDDQGCDPNCGATNRFRQVRWQNDLAPNNDAHTITFWANVDLTPETQLRALFSLAYWTQNDPFLPWTLNTAIKPIIWDALSPITNPTDVNQLPARSLNGKMRNINTEVALVNRSERFRFQAYYRSQSLDTLTRPLFFPGYAAFGDSTWRAPRTDFYNVPIENLDWDFRRQNIDGGFQWNIAEILTWKLDYDWEIWNRKFRDVNRNNLHSIRNRLDFEFNLSGNSNTAGTTSATQAVGPKALTLLRLKVEYLYANRRAVAYNTQPLTFCPSNALPGNPEIAQCPVVLGGAPANSPQSAWVVTSFTTMNDGVPIEFNLLRRWDETGRIRHDGSFKVELLKGPRTNFSASYRYLGDDYDKNFYGLLFNHFSFIDAQFSHAFENGTFLYASYSREMNRFSYRDVAHLLPNPQAPPGAVVQGVLAQFPIANTWERTSRSSLDSFEFGINVAPQEGKLKKWQFDLSYALSSTRDRISTVNPFAVRTDSAVHAGANPYPDTFVRRQDVNVAITRRIKENLEVGGRYWYEPYKQDDFSYNVLAPYVHGSLTSDTPKYLFQDARYGTYHANVATVFVRYTF